MKTKQLILYVLCVVFFTSCNTKEVKKIIFQPSSEIAKDAAIAEGNVKANFSKLDRLHVLSLSINDSIPNDSRFLLRFNFEGIPKNTKIDSAFIYLAAFESGHFGKNNSLAVEPLKNIWINDEVNWENQPESDSTKGIIVPAPTHNNQNYRINITGYVNGVLNNTQPNFGHLFKLEDEKKSYKGLKFHSGESKDELKRPKLEVYYSE